ncbi:MAG: dual specificity protein phosphatase family protein [Nitrososphaerota archaeon]|nr:dual specificity protein phosphatase family protein [Nitrososphaerota archaeon]
MGTGGVFLRKLRARVEDRPTGFVWVEGKSLAGSGYPASRSQVAWLAKNGVQSILTLTEKPLPSEWTGGLGLALAHVSMKDHEPPSVASISEGVKFIDTQRSSGKSVLVHCLAGEGRTGCVLSAYLIRVRGLSADEAMRELRSIKPEFVERAQEDAVREFAAEDRATWSINGF